MSRFENLWNQRAGAFGQDRSDSSGASRFSYSMSGSSGSGPRTSSSSFRMTSSSGGSFPQAQSLGSSMTGGCSECGGCGQQQQGSSAFRQNPVANSGPCGFQERAEVGHGRDLFGEVRRDLVSLENSGNGKITGEAIFVFCDVCVIYGQSSKKGNLFLREWKYLFLLLGRNWRHSRKPRRNNESWLKSTKSPASAHAQRM